MPKQLDITRFNTWSEYVDYCVNTKPPVHVGRRQSRDGTESFTGTRSWDKAVDMMTRFEWPDVQKRVRNLSNLLVNRISGQVIQTTITYDVEGNALDIGAYCSGDPEYWQVFEEELVDGPGTTVHKLVYNMCASSAVDKDVIIHRGVLLSSLVNLLELNGHRVEVTLCFGSSSTSQCMPQDDAWHDECYVTVKNAHQPLDINRLTVAMAHPSSLRRLDFARMEAYSTEEKLRALGVGGGYGFPHNGSERGDIAIEQQEWDTISDPNSIEDAEKWLVSQLEKQGIKFSNSH